MNLTLHIIRKDLIQFRWALAVWSGCFFYLFLQNNLVAPIGMTSLRDFLQVFALFGLGVLSIGLIAGIVQEDHPDDSSGLWRTRPISPARLLTAKLLLIGTLFIGLPLLMAGLKSPGLQTWREYGLVALILTSVTLSFIATSTCTKKGAHSLVLWLGIIFATGTLAELLSRFSPILSRQAMTQMYPVRVLVLLGFSAMAALGVILNQYFRRRLGMSIALLIVGAVGSALIGTMWGYFYFYSSQ